MSRVAYTRSSDAPPPLLETLDVEADGSWRAWLSNGPVIGRFEDDAGGGEILAAADAASGEAPPEPADLSSHPTVDRVVLGASGTEVAVPASAEPGGAWGTLLAASRSLVESAAAHPASALAIVIVAPNRIRIEQRGIRPLTVEFGRASVDATVWAGDGTFVASGRGTVDAERVEAGPGWALEVALDGIDGPVRGDMVVAVSFVADDGGVYIPVMLAAGRAPG